MVVKKKIQNFKAIKFLTTQRGTSFTENFKSNVNKFHNSMQYFVIQCSVCHEAWPLTTKPKSCSYDNYICCRCIIDKQIQKKFSAANSRIPFTLPAELQNLTQIEEMLIARALLIMRVYVKPGGQRGYPGHCINLSQNVSKLAQSLPRCPSKIPIIIVTMKGKDNTMKDVIVRRKNVEQALYWLIRHNPQYNCVHIDLDTREALPENGIPSNIQTIETLDDPDAADSYSTDPIASEDEVYNRETDANSFLPQPENEHLEIDAIKSCLKILPKLIGQLLRMNH